MKKILFIILLVLCSLGAGAFGVFYFAPQLGFFESDVPAEEIAEDDASQDDFAYLPMNNQFIIPVIEDESIESLVVLTITLETFADQTETVYERQPKIRATILRTLLTYSNIGGFSGNFTSDMRMDRLNTLLRDSVALEAGTLVNDVLIQDIARQDV
ncbi:MAG: flagellar basal body-associated protein FliL [Pseudomonadota bacterium]